MDAPQKLVDSEEAMVFFYFSGIEEVLNVSSADRVVQALVAKTALGCDNDSCELSATCQEPLGMLPGPSEGDGKPRYLPPDSDKHTAIIRCRADDCPSRETVTQVAIAISKLEKDCGDASSEVFGLSEPIKDSAEAIRDAILDRAKEEATDAYLEELRKIDTIKGELFADLRDSVTVHMPSTQ